MPSATKFANANTVVTTGWTSSANAYADDSAYATALPAKNASVTSDFGVPAFTTSDIPDGSSIDSVTAEIQYKASVTTSTGAVIGLQLKNTSLLSTEATAGMVLTDTLLTKQVTSGIALADLRIANQVQARVRGFRSSSNTAITWSVDYVKITVAYTLGITGTGSIGFVLGASGTGTVADSPIGGVGQIGFTLGVSGTGQVSIACAGQIGFTLGVSGQGAVEVQGQGSAGFRLGMSGQAGVEIAGVGSIGFQFGVQGTLNSLVVGAGQAGLVIGFEADGTVAWPVVSIDGMIGFQLGASGNGQVDIQGVGQIGFRLGLAADGSVKAQAEGELGFVLGLSGTGQVEICGVGAIAFLLGGVTTVDSGVSPMPPPTGPQRRHSARRIALRIFR